MAADAVGDSSRTRCRNNLLHLIYDSRFANLKVTKKCRSSLAVMGIPGRNGDHFLWPEEAAFLVENCLALVTCNSRPMTQYDCYRILQEKKVSWAKYYAYCTLKRSGFVVVRPKSSRSHQILQDVKREEKEDMKTEEKRDEAMAMLLSCFPSLHTSSLHMPQLHMRNDLVPVECAVQPHPSVLKTSKNSTRNRQCRPKYWPSLSEATASSSWTEYAQLKKQAITRATEKRQPSSSENFSLNIDYEIYHPQVYSYNVDVTPVFRLICIDSQKAPFSLSEVGRRIADKTIVFSIFDGGKVNFVNVSGASIDLNQCHTL